MTRVTVVLSFIILCSAVILSVPLGGSWEVCPIVFRNVAQTAGVMFVLQNDPTPEKHQIETMPGGVAVIDYNNDGFEDLYFVNGASIPSLRKTDPKFWNRLYRNNGDGTFTDVTAQAGVAGEGYSIGVAVGDYDNDGWDDLFIAGVNRNILFRNNGDGTFSDVTEKAGLATAAAGKPWSVSAGWFDYDRDGLLDLFVVNYCKWNPNDEPYCGLRRPGYRTYCHPKVYEGLPNNLYHNNGDGTFTDVSRSSGIGAYIGKGMGLAFADYDGDGWMDVFVANDAVRHFLFHNDGNGHFTESALTAGVAFNEDGQAVSGMGVDFRDINNDGRPDLFITALSNETFSLYRNIGGRGFLDVTSASGLSFISFPWGGWSTGLVDFNNDGWKDIFVAGSHVMDNQELYSDRTSRQPNRVFVNTGDGRFVDGNNGSGAGFWKARFHRGCAFGDFDNDGRVDVAVSSLGEPAEVLRNVTACRNHWLQLCLKGTRSNRDGIGARVSVTSQSGRVQFNHVTTAVGYASASTKRLHFGLGRDTSVARVEIKWPSGVTQVLKDIGVDRTVVVLEPE